MALAIARNRINLHAKPKLNYSHTKGQSSRLWAVEQKANLALLAVYWLVMCVCECVIDYIRMIPFMVEWSVRMWRILGVKLTRRTQLGATQTQRQLNYYGHTITVKADERAITAKPTTAMQAKKNSHILKLMSIIAENGMKCFSSHMTHNQTIPTSHRRADQRTTEKEELRKQLVRSC